MGWEVTWLCDQFSVSGRELFAEVKCLAMAQAKWALHFIQNLQLLFVLREVPYLEVESQNTTPPVLAPSNFGLSTVQRGGFLPKLAIWLQQKLSAPTFLGQRHLVKQLY